jgi:hypothetical protein
VGSNPTLSANFKLIINAAGAAIFNIVLLF